MKLFKAIMLGITMIFLISLSGCKEENSYENLTKVIFELEGGVYQNCTLPITHYYNIQDGETMTIYNPSDLSLKNIERAGYVFKGWFQTKEVIGDNVTYSDEWDFTTDKISKDGITLYAYWKKAISYTYNVCYLDDNNETVIIGTYEVNEGEKYSDYLNFAKKRYGYTPIRVLDESGNPWDNNFTHPGGEENLAINVYIEYIEGEYNLVSTAEELIKYKNTNIYLLNDIDMGGREFSFGDYSKNFQGNNYTISNFKIQYSAQATALVPDFDEPTQKSLCVSIFKSLNGATVENVNFENVSVDITTTYQKTYKIYVAPISTKITNSTVSNVSFNGSFGYSELPSNFDKEDSLIFVTDKAYYIIDEKSVIEDVIINAEIN